MVEMTYRNSKSEPEESWLKWDWMSHGCRWQTVCHKLLIYWDFQSIFTKQSLEFTENALKNTRGKKKCLGNVRGCQRMCRLVGDRRKATATKSPQLCHNWGTIWTPFQIVPNKVAIECLIYNIKAAGWIIIAWTTIDGLFCYQFDWNRCISSVSTAGCV